MNDDRLTDEELQKLAEKLGLEFEPANKFQFVAAVTAVLMVRAWEESLDQNALTMNYTIADTMRIYCRLAGLDYQETMDELATVKGLDREILGDADETKH